MKLKEKQFYRNPETTEIFLIIQHLPGIKLVDTPWKTEDVTAYYVVQSTYMLTPMVIKQKAMEMMELNNSDEQAFVQELIRADETLAETARRFAITSHNMVNQYYGDQLYSYHLAKVVGVGKRFKHLIPEEDWDHVEAGLWNHDGIEDARLTRNDVVKVLGDRAADIAYALTNEKGKNRKERASDKYYSEMQEVMYASFAKICDRIANVENSVKDGHGMADGYRKEQKHFSKNLYVPGYYEEMWDHLEDLLGVYKA